MEEFLIFILVLFATNSFEQAESVQLEELPLQTFDELFVEEWWDKDGAEDLKTPPPTNFGQNVHHQIDRQNTQLGQIKPNSTDQHSGQIEPNSTDKLGQIKPNSTDQSPPLTESDHSGQIEPNSTDQNPPLIESDHSGKIEPNSTDKLGQIEPNSTDKNPPLIESDHSGQIEPNSTDQHSGQIEPNSTDKLGQIEPNSTDQNPPLTESDHPGKIEPNSTDQNPPLTESDQQIEPKTDQNPPLTESDHFNNAKNGEEQNEITYSENIAEEEQKRKIVAKFHEMKDEFKQKGNFSAKEWNQIDQKIAEHLKVTRAKIYKWKKEFGLSRRNPKNEQKNLVEKFDQIKAELTLAEFKNSYHHEIDKTVAKKLGLSFRTIYKWKQKLGQTKPTHKHSHSEQMELMKCYYEIKDTNPKISDEDIAKIMKIGTDTLVRWKKQFKRHQLHPNSADGQSLDENAGSNIQLGRELFE